MRLRRRGIPDMSQHSERDIPRRLCFAEFVSSVRGHTLLRICWYRYSMERLASERLASGGREAQGQGEGGGGYEEAEGCSVRQLKGELTMG